MISVAQNKITLALTLGVPCALALWILTAGTDALPSTLVLVALIVSAMGFVGLDTMWNNSRATGSMAPIIRETDISPASPEDRPVMSSHEQHRRR